MELFKPDGTLKKQSALIAHYRDYFISEAKQAYEADRKVQHALLFPETIEVTEVIDAVNVTKQVPNPNYISYDEWIAEEYVITPAVLEIVDPISNMVTPAKDAVMGLVREFIVPEVTEVMLDTYLYTNKTYKKTYGESYGIYRIPFKNEDAMGLLQVKAAFELGLTNTNIIFSNGTIMPIEAKDFMTFASWFVEKRNSFFV